MPRIRTAFTLVELLVTLVILALLIGLLLPAVQAARETARKSQCSNHLRQLSLGLLRYHNTHLAFPPGGWGEAWVGFADRGFGEDQPGGWAFSLLPYVEESSLYELDRGLALDEARRSRSERVATPIALFVCPSRRATRAWSVSDRFPDDPARRPHLSQPRGAAPIASAARSDYAMNLGNEFVSAFAGPFTLEEGESEHFIWPDRRNFDGIAHLRISVRLAQVTDGSSHTYLLGEKFLSPNHYADGVALGDNETLYSGFSSDLYRSTRVDLTISQDFDAEAKALGDWRFGSAHSDTLRMAFCDGSVRSIAYTIDPSVHTEGGSRGPTQRSVLIVPRPRR